MMHQYSVSVLADFPISKDNHFNRVDKYGRDLGATWDIYVLDGNARWVWAGYAWSRRQAWGRAKQMSYTQFTATMAIGEDDVGYDEFFFAYGKKVA